MVIFEKFPMTHRMVRRGPGWAFGLVGRHEAWWVKARAIRGVRWVTKSTSYWLYQGQR